MQCTMYSCVFHGVRHVIYTCRAPVNTPAQFCGRSTAAKERFQNLLYKPIILNSEPHASPTPTVALVFGVRQLQTCFVAVFSRLGGWWWRGKGWWLVVEKRKGGYC